MWVSSMGQVLIRNVDDAVLTALRTRAATRGISLEAELRDVLARAAGHPRAPTGTPKGPRRQAEELVREGRDER
jgi:hypothetical protein